MKNQIVMMNFSGVYEKESFYKNEEFYWLDCTNIRGTNCYCDETAKGELGKLIQNYPPYGIHFIDSGNYNYVSKFWMDKITEPFSLLLFDHHSDMQPSAFGNVLSCGSWVEEALNTCPNLDKVYLMGVDEKYVIPVKDKYKNRLAWYSEKALTDEKTRDWFSGAHGKEPFYISVDKDILNTETVITNWDQGNVTFETLESLLRVIMENQKIIGMDICGECTHILEGEKNPKLYKDHDRVNQILLRDFLKAVNR